MKSAEPHLSRWQKTRGLLAAATVAWALTTVADLGWPTLEVWFASTFLNYDGYVPPLSQALGWVTLYAIVGIPLALVVCFAIGFLAWRFAEKRGLTTRIDAIKVGAGVAFIVGALGIALGLLASLPTALSEGSTFNSWSWGRQVIRDGLPTPLGWAFQAVDLLVTVGVGSLAGLAAWWAAGSRRAA